MCLEQDDGVVWLYVVRVYCRDAACSELTAMLRLKRSDCWQWFATLPTSANDSTYRLLFVPLGGRLSDTGCQGGCGHGGWTRTVAAYGSASRKPVLQCDLLRSYEDGTMKDI